MIELAGPTAFGCMSASHLVLLLLPCPQALPPLLCRHLVCVDTGPPAQEAAAAALQKLAAHLPPPARLAAHAAVLGLLTEAAGHLSTQCIVRLLDLLTANAPYDGYLTQHSAHTLRMLALVKDEHISLAAARAVAALPVTGSGMSAAEAKFAFLEKMLLPLPVLRRSPASEPSASPPEQSTPLNSTTDLEEEASAEKQPVLSPGPLALCRPSPRELFGSADFEASCHLVPATAGPPVHSQAPSVISPSPNLFHPRPSSLRRSALTRSHAGTKSPSLVGRSRDLASFRMESPHERRPTSPSGQTANAAAAAAAKRTLSSQPAVGKESVTRTPLQTLVQARRSNEENELLSPTLPRDALRGSGSKTLGQVASQYQARKEVWRRTAARKEDSVTARQKEMAKASAMRAVGVPADAQTAPLGQASLGTDSGVVGHGAIEEASEALEEEPATARTCTTAMEDRSGESSRKQEPQWDALSIAEWVTLAIADSEVGTADETRVSC
jgi:hypothetical protein